MEPYDDNEQYVVFCFELGVLGFGVNRAYGMDIRAMAEGIEFQLTLEQDEYQVLGYFEPEL